jgi:uncharacterized membrane protein
MNERSELERLKQRQARLEQELGLLAGQLKEFEARLNASPPAAAPVPPRMEPSPAPPPAEIRRVVPPPIPVPPVIQPVMPSASVQAKAPGPIPAPVEPRPAAIQPEEFVPSFVRTEAPKGEPELVFAAAETKETSSSPQPAPPRTSAVAGTRSSFEMRVGTYWLVRIGIVMLLTGLVFFGNYAYQNYIVRFGAVGKVVLLYLASGALLGGGAWWQRKNVKESLRNYAQVLFAGGLAAVYFTTYAAHHFENLHVIDSPLLDGVLLLAWAGFIAWIADRKKSEVLALFAVGLAYYTSVITRVGSFTLYSNLVLTAAALVFLLRNRWAGLSWATLVATYAAYAYWRFFHGGEGWRWATPTEGLWFGASFLWGYWLVFTLAVFLSKHEGLAGERRAAFLTFNNGAMFTLFILTMLQVDTGRFWRFFLGYGAVLLGLAELSRRFLAAEPLTKNTYLTQGLVLVTVGFVSKYLDTPRTLALVLAAESVILFILGTLRKNIFLQTGAYLSGAMAVGWGIDGVERNDTQGLWLGTTLGALMILNAFWSHWRTAWADQREFRPVPAYFTALALLIWLFTTWQNTTHANFGLVLTVEAIALTLSIYLLRVPEIPLLGMSYIILAQAAWMFNVPKNTALQLAFALAANGAALRYVGLQRPSLAMRGGACVASALAVLWGIAGLERDARIGLFAGAALGAVMVAKAFWMHCRSAETDARLLRPAPAWFTALALVMWIATTWFNTTTASFPLALAIETVVLTAAIYALRLRELALLGQGLLALAHFAWLAKFMDGVPTPPWWNPLLMIVVTLGLSHWWRQQKVIAGDASMSVAFQTAYALALVALVYFWLEPQNAPPAWLALTSLLAVAATAYGVFTRNWPLAICGQIFLAVSAGQFVWQLLHAKPGWHFALAPMAALGGLSFATWLWFARKPDSKPQVRDPLLQLAMIYRWIALLMAIWWVSEYIPDRERIWVYFLTGLCLFLFAGWQRSLEAMVLGAAFSACGLVSLWLPSQRDLLVYAPNLLALFVFLVQQQIARRQPERYRLDDIIHSLVIVAGCLTVWRFVSCWVLEIADKDYLTATWSALALVLFGCGIGLRERMYRWMGLAVLATALGRVVVFDVWKLETIYRVLSFMALGIVLLVLGFFYNKYQEKIRQWL